MKAVDQRIYGNAGIQRAFHRYFLQRVCDLTCEAFTYAKSPYGLLCFIPGHGRLAHDGRRDPYLVTSDGLADFLKGHPFRLLRRKKIVSGLLPAHQFSLVQHVNASFSMFSFINLSNDATVSLFQSAEFVESEVSLYQELFTQRLPRLCG